MSTPRTVKQQARALAAAENISYTEALRRVLAHGPTVGDPAAGHENAAAADLAGPFGRATLEDLTALGTVSVLQASFLSAAVLAGKSIVVSGMSGSGKTTLLRALCAAIPVGQQIGIIEETSELSLPERDATRVRTIPTRPETSEVRPDGRQLGAIALDDAVQHSFRFNLTHQVVGEVRGCEVWAMVKAIESGTTSMSTTRAADAEAAIRKLVICAMEAGEQVTADLATFEIAQTIDLIVQLHVDEAPHGSDQRRWVSEIFHVTPSTDAARGYATTQVFAPNPAGGPALPGTLPDELRRLEQHGFDLSGYSEHSR